MFGTVMRQNDVRYLHFIPLKILNFDKGATTNGAGPSHGPLQEQAQVRDIYCNRPEAATSTGSELRGSRQEVEMFVGLGMNQGCLREQA